MHQKDATVCVFSCSEKSQSLSLFLILVSTSMQPKCFRKYPVWAISHLQQLGIYPAELIIHACTLLLCHEKSETQTYLLPPPMPTHTMKSLELRLSPRETNTHHA